MRRRLSAANRPTRLMILVPTVTGARLESRTIRLARYLKRRGVEVCVASVYDTADEVDMPEGVEHAQVRFGESRAGV